MNKLETLISNATDVIETSKIAKLLKKINTSIEVEGSGDIANIDISAED